jgi:hypothetical protein
MSRQYKNSKDVPTSTLIKRLNELSDAICEGRESQAREFTMRIPAECDRDADLVLAEAARRLEAYENPKNWTRSFNDEGKLINEHALYKPKLKNT